VPCHLSPRGPLGLSVVGDRHFDGRDVRALLGEAAVVNHAIHSAVTGSTSWARDISTRDGMPTTEAETINHDLLDFLKT
jgi:hypothetical protein